MEGFLKLTAALQTQQGVAKQDFVGALAAPPFGLASQEVAQAYDLMSSARLGKLSFEQVVDDLYRVPTSREKHLIKQAFEKVDRNHDELITVAPCLLTLLDG